MRGGSWFENVHGQVGGKTLDVDRKGGWGVLKIRQFSWTSYVYDPLRSSIFLSLFDELTADSKDWTLQNWTGLSVEYNA